MTTTADTMKAPVTQEGGSTHHTQEDVLKFKKRMLEWGNPVEFVNNMYGCHPDDEGNEYFKKVFKR